MLTIAGGIVLAVVFLMALPAIIELVCRVGAWLVFGPSCVELAGHAFRRLRGEQR
jgi:hypothetical protein